MKCQNQSGNTLVGILILGAFIWFIVSVSGNEEEKDTYKSDSYYSDYEEEPTDGYSWAEENDVTSFDECQDQFGTGLEEDECNEYVKDNYSDYSTFEGYECTEDCSGHEAGYSWAEENYISDPAECDGNSNSFIEGCIAFAEENF